MVYVLLGAGFEELEAVAPVDLMRRAGINVKYAGIGGDMIAGRSGITIKADIRIEEMNLGEMEMLVLPGGGMGVESIGASEEAVKAIRYAFDNGRYIAALCAAPTLLGQLGLLNGVTAVCYPGMEDMLKGAVWAGDVKAVRDGRFITGQAAGAAVDFGLRLVEALRGEPAALDVGSAIHYECRSRF